MKPRFCGIIFLLLGLITSARAQVQASLVSSERAAAPGQPFRVAVRLIHRPTWHTYWLNPGTGLATSIQWTLPAGWKAGNIEWPAPHVIHDRTGAVTGNGYEGDLLLPVMLTPPPNAPAGPVRLAAAVDWLMCQNVCMPGNAKLTLDLAIRPGEPEADPIWGPRIDAVARAAPRADSAWPVAADRSGNTITLRVARGPGAVGTPSGLHFFADDNLVGYELPQKVAPDGRGGYVLTLAASPDGPQNATSLHGVLTAANGWKPDGTEPALRVDVPFGVERVVPNSLDHAAEPVGASQGGGGGQSGLGTTRSTLGGTLLLAFLGGVILNLMPCVFPVLGIKILGFVNQAGTDRKKVVAHGLAFTAGVLLSFWLLVGVLVLLRTGGSKLGWGYQLQSPAFVFALAIIMLVFALNLSGLFEFGLSATAVGGSLQSRSGYSGSFFTGVLATLVATPCSAPLVAPALGAALTLPVAECYVVFTAMALGLSAPYLLLSVFPSAVRILPRPGAWMETFRQFMAFPLYGTVGYLAWVLAGQVQESAFLNVLLGLVIVAMGIWVYGRFRAPGASAGRARFGLIAGLAVLAAGVWAGWPVPPKSDAVVWAKWSPDEVAKLHAEGRIVYVDFTARWCATCQANKKVVFHSEDVLRAFRDRHIATLRGDWTNQDPAITAELAKYHRSAVPFNQVWLPGKDEPELLPELLTPSVVLKAVGS